MLNGVKGYCGSTGEGLPEKIIYDIKNISNIKNKSAF